MSRGKIWTLHLFVHSKASLNRSNSLREKRQVWHLDVTKTHKQDHFYWDQPCTSIFPTYWSLELRITVTSSIRAAILKLTTSELLGNFPSETKSNKHWPEVNIVCEALSSNNGMASQNKDVKACNHRFGFIISERFSNGCRKELRVCNCYA